MNATTETLSRDTGNTRRGDEYVYRVTFDEAPTDPEGAAVEALGVKHQHRSEWNCNDINSYFRGYWEATVVSPTVVEVRTYTPGND